MKNMFRLQPIRYIVFGHILALTHSPVFAQASETPSFASLLDIARSHAAATTFVDAEPLDVGDQSALKFLFRTENGKLLSVVLDTKTAEIVPARRTQPNRVAPPRQNGDTPKPDNHEQPSDGNHRQQRSSSQEQNVEDGNRTEQGGSDERPGRDRRGGGDGGSGNRSGRE
ncbi:MAG: hypothetical protein AAFP98_07550 [Pseudomonadota bacterium]